MIEIELKIAVFLMKAAFFSTCLIRKSMPMREREFTEHDLLILKISLLKNWAALFSTSASKNM